MNKQTVGERVSAPMNNDVEESALEPFGPGDLMWDWTGDIRSMFSMPGMLVLQTFHPTVADATGEHSVFETDPWGRQTMARDSVLHRTYGGSDAIAEGVRLRALHKSFTGVGHDGKRYGALNPDAYGWVHNTAYNWLLTTAEHFGTPFSHEEKLKAYAEHLRSGRMLGLRDKHMPPTMQDFDVYWKDRIENRLQDHPTLHRLFNSLASPLPPPQLSPRLHPAWPLPGILVGRFGGLLIRGYLPPQAREVAGLPWTTKDQRNYDRLRAGIRRAVTALPVHRRHVAIARKARACAAANDQ